jgi:hypothetical protein
VSIGKVQTSVAMLSREKGAFNLNYSLYASFFYVEANWTKGGRLVDDIAEGFGHLNSIFCLPSGDKVNGISGIARGKLDN